MKGYITTIQNVIRNIFVPQKVEETFSYSGILGDLMFASLFSKPLYLFAHHTFLHCSYYIFSEPLYLFANMISSPLFILRIFKSTLSIL